MYLLIMLVSKETFLLLPKKVGGMTFMITYSVAFSYLNFLQSLQRSGSVNPISRAGCRHGLNITFLLAFFMFLLYSKIPNIASRCEDLELSSLAKGHTHPAFTSSKLTIEIPEQCVKSVESNHKYTRTTSLTSLTLFWCLYC